MDDCRLNAIPELLCYNLVSLSLNSNYFQQIPANLYVLKALQVLEMDHNFIETIPDDIVALKSLRTLSLRSNKVKTMSAAVFSLHGLHSLDLSRNELGEIPLQPELAAACHIRTLHLAHNRLATLPDCIVQLSCLETLDLQDNLITELPRLSFLLQKMQGAHRYRGLIKEGLWIYGNPVTFPTPDIWQTTRLDDIWTYLRVIQ